MSAWLDRGLIDQHDGNVVFHGINPVAFQTFQTFGILPVLQCFFARWTYENFQKILGNHSLSIVRHPPGESASLKRKLVSPPVR